MPSVFKPSETFRYFHRITECWGSEGTSVGHPVQPPAQAGSPTAGCTGPRPGGAWISPEKETPQPPWAAWARAPSPSEGRSSSSCSAGASSASVCAHCPLSCRWAPLKRVWPRPADTHPADEACLEAVSHTAVLMPVFHVCRNCSG